jgi:hypothetical protein
MVFCRTFYASAVEFIEKIGTRVNTLSLRDFFHCATRKSTFGLIWTAISA